MGDLIDPISLVVFWPVWFLFGQGPVAAVLGWNALHLATVCLGGLGGWLLARRLLPDPSSWLVVVGATAASPYLMASAQLGRSEYLAGAWYPLHLAFLHAHLSPTRTRRDTVLAVLTLVGLAWSGWTLALWVAALEIPVALVFSGQIDGWLLRVRRLAEVALPALVGVLPFLGAVLWLGPWWLNRLKPDQIMPVVLVMPLQNLVRFFHAYPVGGGLELAPYPGTITVLLMGVALWVRPRAVLPWMAFALALLVVALGPEIQIAGPEMPVWRGYAPVSWLMSLVPGTRAIQNWPRVAALMSGPLGVAAAWGVAETGRRRRRNQLAICAGLAVLIVLDHATWAGFPEDAAFIVTLPEDVKAALDVVPDGPILELPIDNDFQPQFGVWEDFSLLWQLQHRRASSEAPSPIRAAAYKLSVLAVGLGSSRLPADMACSSSEQSRLYEAGFRAVVLQKRRLAVEQAPTFESAIDDLLGKPAHTEDRVASWALKMGEPVPDACKPPI